MNISEDIVEASHKKLRELLLEMRDISHEVDSTAITICNGKSGSDQMEYMQLASSRLHESLDGDDVDLDKISNSIRLIKDIASIAEFSRYSISEESAEQKIDRILLKVQALEDDYNDSYLVNDNISSSINRSKI